jgi:hypothetical protein
MVATDVGGKTNLRPRFPSYADFSGTLRKIPIGDEICLESKFQQVQGAKP